MVWSALTRSCLCDESDDEVGETLEAGQEEMDKCTLLQNYGHCALHLVKEVRDTVSAFATKICRMPGGNPYDEAGQTDDEDDESSKEEPKKCSWLRASLDEEEEWTPGQKILLVCVPMFGPVFALWFASYQTVNFVASDFVKDILPSAHTFLWFIVVPCIIAVPVLLFLASLQPMQSYHARFKEWTVVRRITFEKLQWALIVLIVLVPLVLDYGTDLIALNIFYKHTHYQYLTINLLAIFGAAIWAGITMRRDGFGTEYACFAICFLFPVAIVFYVFRIMYEEKDKDKCQQRWVQTTMPVLVIILVQSESALETLISGTIQLHARIHHPPSDRGERNKLALSVIVTIILMAKSFAMVDKKGHVSRWLCIKSEDGSESSSSSSEEEEVQEYIPMVVGVAPYASVPFIFVYAYRLACVESRLLFFVLVQQATQGHFRLLGMAMAGTALLLGDAVLQGLLIWRATGNLSKIFYALANTVSVMEPLLHSGPAIFTAEITHVAKVHLFEEVTVLSMLVYFKGFDQLLRHDFRDLMLPVSLCIVGLVSKYILLIIIRRFCVYPGKEDKDLDQGTKAEIEDDLKAAGADKLDRQVPAYLIVFGLALDKGPSIDRSSNISKISATGSKALMLHLNDAIETLDMKRWKCGDSGAVAIANGLKKNKYKSLYQLDLSYNDIGVKTNSGCEALGRMLAAIENPEFVAHTGVDHIPYRLDLLMQNNQCGDKGAKDIAKGLEENKSLIIKLQLQKNDIGVEGFKALGDMLKTHTAIKFLGVAENKGGDTGATNIAKALETNKSLTYLDIAKNEIGTDGSKALGKMLEVNDVIRRLSMWENHCGDEGTKHLAKGLKVNKSLTNLSLNRNNIGTSGFQALGEMLLANKKIEQLIVPGNKMCGKVGATALAQGLKVNKSLKSLILKNIETPIDTSDKEALEQAETPCKLVF